MFFCILCISSIRGYDTFNYLAELLSWVSKVQTITKISLENIGNLSLTIIETFNLKVWRPNTPLKVQYLTFI